MGRCKAFDAIVTHAFALGIGDYFSFRCAKAVLELAMKNASTITGALSRREAKQELASGSNTVISIAGRGYALSVRYRYAEAKERRGSHSGGAR